MDHNGYGNMKQNWLLTGVCVGSVIMAILGWTRTPDCNCPKDLNATIESTVAKAAPGVTLGERAPGDAGQASPMGRPRSTGAAAPTGQSAPATTTTIANARGPLGQPVGAGNGGAAPVGGTPFDGTSGAGGALGGWRGAGAPGAGTSTGVEVGKPAFGAGGGSGTSAPTGTTTGGSQGTGSTSGNPSPLPTPAPTSTPTPAPTPTPTPTPTPSGSKPHPDDFGPHDPNGHKPDGKPHKKGGPDDFGPHRDGPDHGKPEHDKGKGDGKNDGHGKPEGGPKPEHKPGADGDPKKDRDHGGWWDRFGMGGDHGGKPNGDPHSATEVPEPGTFGLAGVALAGLGFARYRRRKARGGDASSAAGPAPASQDEADTPPEA